LRLSTIFAWFIKNLTILKKRLLQYTLPLIFLVAFFGISQRATAQATVSFSYASGGVNTTNPIVVGSSVVLYGFSVTVGGTGSITFAKYYIGSNSGDVTQYMTNATLMRCTSSSYVRANSTPVGNVNLNSAVNSTSVTIDNLSETIATGNTNYYFLVADAIGSSGSLQLFINNMTIAVDANGTNYSTNGNGNMNQYTGFNYTTGGTAPPIRITPEVGGLNANTTTLIAGNSGVAMLGFSLTSTGTYSMSQININSNITTLSNYFSGFTLYTTNGTTSYSTGARVAVTTGTITMSGGSIQIPITSTNLQATTTKKYYWLVANLNASISSSILPATPQFKITNGQSTAGFISSSPSGSFNTATVYGPTYSINTNNITMVLQSSGLASTPIYSGQNSAGVFGFSMVNSSGSSTITQMNVNSDNSTLSTVYTNPRLYKSTSSTFSSAIVIPGNLLSTGTISAGSNFINFSGFSTAVTTTIAYYYVVVDVIYTGASNNTTLKFTTGQSATALTQTSPASTYNNFAISGSTYNIVQPSFSASAQTTGIPTSPLIYNQSSGVFGFSVTATGNTTISQFYFQADGHTNTLQALFGVNGGTLYRSGTGSTFTPGSPGTAVGTVTFNNSDVTITGLTEIFTSGQTNNYFLVVNDIYSSYTTADAARFFMNSSNAITISSGNTFAANGIYETSYTISKRAVGYTFYAANASTNNITQGTIYPGQTGVVLYGFGISTDVSATISQFILNSAYSGSSPQTQFSNSTAILYSSSSSVFSTSTASPVSGASFTFANGTSPGVTISGFTQTLSATPTYYFIVADVNLSSNTLSASTGNILFKLEASQSNPVTQTLPASSNITVPSDMLGYNFPTSPPTLTVTGANTAANGITQGDITYGQSNIVLFGFKAVAAGIFTINQINMQTTNSGVAIYEAIPTGTLYRSTDQYFAHAVPVTGTVGFNPVRISGMSETLNSTNGTGTYWYFLVGNAPTTTTSNNNYTAGTIKFQFDNGAGNMFQQTSPFKVINNITVTDGTTFNVSNDYIWLGGTASHLNDFTTTTNFKTHNGSGIGAAPGFTGSTITVSIGSVTNYPTITASTELGGLTFNNSASKITLSASTVLLTLNKGMDVTAGATANIVGPGKISIAAAAVSTVASTGIIKLTTNSEITNLGTFTLKSDVSGSAAIDQLSGTSKLTGSFNVERYITGGSTTYRSYRMLSSPTNISSSTVGVGNIDIGYLNNNNTNALTGMLIGGPGAGFSVTNATPTVYFYREDVAPSTTSFNGGKHKGVTAISSSTTVPANNYATIAYNTGLTPTTNYTIPVGTGFISYNAGSTGQPGNITPGTAPVSYAITSKGYLNQGTVTYKYWYTGSTGLSYTLGLLTNIGFNMVGNPYPSTIDLSSFYSTNSGSIQQVIFELSDLNPNQDYIGFNAQTLATSQPTGASGASRYIASGQGFLVQRRLTGSSLTFNETHKLASQQLTGTNLLLGIPVKENTLTGFFMKMEQASDSTNYDYCGIYFGTDSDNLDDNDGVDLDGASPKLYMSSYTADLKRTCINSMSDYKPGKTIKLYANGLTDGVYKLKIEEIKNIDAAYDIWLMDAYKKDSLDMRSNNTYSFNVVRSDATTYGGGRFSLVIRKKKLPPYQFLSLTAGLATQGINVTWKAQNEYNFTGFTVEKLDANQQYQPLYYVQSDGSGTYSFLDKNPITGINTYHIKQDDIDNKITYSTDASVNTVKTAASNGKFIVYPNPVATSTINIQFVSELTGPVNVMVANSSGGVISKTVFNQASGTIDVSKLKTGVYFVKVTSVQTGQEIGSEGFVKL
jgi:hypothetical protein